MLFLFRENSDHWREPAPAISPLGNAGKQVFVREVGTILKAVLGALLTSHANSNFFGTSMYLDLLKYLVSLSNHLLLLSY